MAAPEMEKPAARLSIVKIRRPKVWAALFCPLSDAGASIKRARGAAQRPYAPVRAAHGRGRPDSGAAADKNKRAEPL